MNRFKMCPIRLTSLCLLLAFVTSARSATVTLEPSADTALWELGPDNNLGGTLLSSGTTAIPSKSRTLVKFDVAGSVPAGATITAARLRLVVVRVPGPNGPLVPSNFNLHRMLLSWEEGNKTSLIGDPASSGETTWNNRFHSFISPTRWSTPGAGPGVDFETTVSSSALVMTLGSYDFIDLAADVQLWLNNSNVNFGWILISDAEDQSPSAVRLGSRESLAPSERPQITIEYTLPTMPHIDSITAVAGNQFSIQFNVRAGHAYVVECRADLSVPGTTCTNLPVQAVTGPVIVTLPMTGAKGFVRVGEQ